MQLDLNQLRELLADIDKTNISELTLKSADFELTVRKELLNSDRSLSPMGSMLTGGVRSSELASSPVVSPSGSSVTEKVTPSGSSTTSSVSSTTLATDSKWVEVTSPMVGTFYRSPAPDEPPFVEKSDRVTVGQVVCIIEAMKLMNEIESEFSGQIVEILVENGSPVEYGQVLMRINPE
ncbi:MAG: acetyl-CoA carboxylase biotin carboxyl carrier protein [Limnoraphis robusta]|uniref:Biotin carboxyl carrier protein of acetyl-CoA carboxylase n=2 Tax=Limnoraphis robusta TaxID=1118279 RepID=A0A0F5Y9I5_9CYAN|nr:acetyl-CoA carboxylase biotin carboxyl carrier protein [Limnoraphis robusta]KKD35297.1 carboxylesterase [Limnoraphis robusta CS-951]MEA5497714.1 acetyl-CoA carboxylase biotin carboxyl carrier protein [Limnoraphis robusta BA-68 BA1]MEA5519307.1 acetyl-CoA carboxylase biotin carboxyl carrier protein [Limnoraphis robusta CCNP1315]MEA5538068.1 acetyl-CoA carboxylase biotin carboxyl carrier protein [Limnoraphis robusta Tam1]MEA5549049.1 acetyl-CoA carboxylase biotin carboxyl carrier protein [Lim